MGRRRAVAPREPRARRTGSGPGDAGARPDRDGAGTASREARPHPSHDGADHLAVAAWGEEAASVRALVADARHLDARFTASLPDDAGSVAATIRGAAETLLADVGSRRSDLPPEPTADDWGVTERLVADLRRDATGGPGRTADAPGPAAAVVDANGRLASLRALRRVRPRLDGADADRIESAADVGALRTDATTRSGPRSRRAPHRSWPAPS